MSSINSLIHHIDQLLTQQRALQKSHTQLQNQVQRLEQQLLQEQEAASSLNQDAQLESERAHIQTLEDELTHLISLFEPATEAQND